MRAAGGTLTVGELISCLLSGTDNDRVWGQDTNDRLISICEVDRSPEAVLLTIDDVDYDTQERLLCECMSLLRELSDPKARLTKERRTEIESLTLKITEETGIA